MASGPTMRPIGSPASSRSSTSKQMCQPAAPHETKRAVDVDPEREARAAARRLELPPEIAAAPAVLEQPRRLGALHGGLGDVRRRRADRRQLHRPRGGQVPIGVERRPFGQVRRIGQRFPHHRRRMTELTDQDQRPLLAVLLDVAARRPRGRARTSPGCSSAGFLFPVFCVCCCLRHPIEVAFQRVDVRRPEAPERGRARRRPPSAARAGSGRRAAAHRRATPRSRPRAARAGAWTRRSAASAACARSRRRIAPTTPAGSGWPGGSAPR